jgi:hypothetical protein
MQLLIESNHLNLIWILRLQNSRNFFHRELYDHNYLTYPGGAGPQ